MGQGLEALYGQVLENTYRITRLIGEGGMGAVYEAEHARLPRKFAIKVLFPHVAKNAVAVERFHREALVTSELGHPHIVDVIDFNHTPDGFPYIVMEYLAGEDLEQRMERVGRIAPQGVNRIVDQTASALEAVHTRGIIHRDLKPQNIFLCDKEGVDDYIKVVDFGISKIRGAGQALTRAHMVMGTPYYMSPEQAKGHADNADRRADIFALGAILYEMLTGNLPFQGETPDVVLYQVVHEDPPSFQELGLDIAPAVEEVVFNAIAKKPEDRWDSMAELSEAFAYAVERTVIDFMPLDDIEGMEAAEEKKVTDRMSSVNEEDPPSVDLAPDFALQASATEQLDRGSFIFEEDLPEEASTEKAIQGHGVSNPSGTAPGLGPNSGLSVSARTTPAPGPVPPSLGSPDNPAPQPGSSDLAETSQRTVVNPPLMEEETEEVSSEAPTEVIDTSGLHAIEEMQTQLASDNAAADDDDDDVDTFKEHRSVAAPGSDLDQAYQHGISQPPIGAGAAAAPRHRPLKDTTFSSNMREIGQRTRSSKIGFFVLAALLIVGGALTYGAVRLMGSSEGDGADRAAHSAGLSVDSPREDPKRPEIPNKETARASAPSQKPGATEPPAPDISKTKAQVKEPKATKAPDSPPAAAAGKAGDRAPKSAHLTKDKPAAKEPRRGPDRGKKPGPRPDKVVTRALNVSSSPAGARVVVNGKRAGLTPLTDFKITTRKVRVVITKVGYKRINRTIRAGSAPQTFNLKLEERARKPALGFLRVATLLKGKPSRAFIFINGKRTGESPLRVSLPEGVHRVEAWRRGVKASSQRATVKAGKTKLVVLKLKGK